MCGCCFPRHRPIHILIAIPGTVSWILFWSCFRTPAVSFVFGFVVVFHSISQLPEGAWIASLTSHWVSRGKLNFCICSTAQQGRVEVAKHVDLFYLSSNHRFHCQEKAEVTSLSRGTRGLFSFRFTLDGGWNFYQPTFSVSVPFRKIPSTASSLPRRKKGDKRSWRQVKEMSCHN